MTRLRIGIYSVMLLLISVGAVSLVQAAAAAGDIVIPGQQLSARDRKVVPVEKRYDGLVVCHGEGGFVEWTAAVKTAGRYSIHVRYSSGEKRPCVLSINGKAQAGKVLSKSTGGFRAAHLKWDTVGPVDLPAGKCKIRLTTKGFLPHLLGLVISQNAAPPKASILRLPKLPKSNTPAPVTLAPLSAAQTAANRAAVRKLLLGVDEIIFIKRYTYTANHYYTEYLNSKWTPGGGIFILSLKDSATRQIATELKGGVFGRMDLSFDAKKVVFDWKASNDEGYRIYEVGLDGQGLRQVLVAPKDEAATVKKYRRGYHHGTDDMHPCYLPDGGIAFVSTRCKTGTLCDAPDIFTTTVLYRMEADGTKLRPLSYGPLSEATPTMLSDGRLLYTRWEYVDKGAVVTKPLWAMRPDGSASVEVYGNTIQYPSTMIQGREIPGAPNLFVFLGCPHYPQNALGTVIRINMDKSIRSTEAMTYITPQVKVLAEGGWHFLDPKSGTVSRDRSGRGPLYRDPWPIDMNHFLVAHKPRGAGSCYAPNGYGLCLLDASSKSIEFYRDAEISCWQPMAVKVRKRPPVLKTSIDKKLAKSNLAQCIVADVYHGMEGVKRGSIKYIRVLEQIARPWAARRFTKDRYADVYDQQHAVVSKDTTLSVRVQHGIVPVEADGSASFYVPANANIYFQALDENYLAVQTERTFVNYIPGEVRSCVGCHETPKDAPKTVLPMLLALKRNPSTPGPQIGEAAGQRPLHYPVDVQPVLDRHCVTCHSAKKKSGGLELTGRMTKFFSASYENLLPERRRGRKDRRQPGLIPTIGENHPKVGNNGYLPPRSLGSHNSLLMAMLMPGKIALTGDAARLKRLASLQKTHKALKLTPAELLKISNWVDTNVPYYGSYYGRRNLADKAHPNFRPVPTWDSARGKPPLPEEKR